MDTTHEKIKDCVRQIREKTDFVPKLAIILGSGLGQFASNIKKEIQIPYNDIKGFPVSTVKGHSGKFTFGCIEDVPAVVMEGRVHYYEGYDISDVVLPVRVMRMLGAQTLIITNAAGGINERFSEAGLMLISDHISLNVPSPLIGRGAGELGERFPDMSKVYDRSMRRLVMQAAEDMGIDLFEGVYYQTTGPNYETPAEVRMIKNLGADAVGMSTACEAVAGKHMGMKICGISCITNLAAGISKNPLSHEEVTKNAQRAARDFEMLLRELIKKSGG